MRSNEARHEAVMQAEDRSERVQARTPTGGQQQGIVGSCGLLRVSEVADLAGISEDSIRRAVSSGSLPAYKIGRCIRIDPGDLQKWLEFQRYQPGGSVTQFVAMPASTDYRW